MRGASYGLIVLGIVIAALGLVNHYVIRANPFAHTSTILIGAGVVVLIIGAILMFVGGRSASN